MIYWILIMIALNLFVIWRADTPPAVRLNAAVVLLIAISALGRIIQKRRQRNIEKLEEEINRLTAENEELRRKIETMK